MKSKMDLESSLYAWKITLWIAPIVGVLLSGAIVFYTNFKIHHIEKQLSIEKELKVEANKNEIISSNNDNKQLIDKLLSITDKGQKDRDSIVGKQYFMSLNSFIVQFRFVIQCLDNKKPLDSNVILAFQPRNIAASPDLSLITEKMIYDLVMEYDFSSKSVKCDNSSSNILNSISQTLLSDTKKILSKYAATASPELIQEIEITLNRTENFIGGYGPWGQIGVWSNSTTQTSKSRENAANEVSGLILKVLDGFKVSEIYK